MKAYISVSFGKRKMRDPEIRAIVDTLTDCKISSLVFVDQYHFNPAEEREMMKQALADIDDCDLLIAETSDKGIGIGIEAGYAKATGKTVIYLRQKDREHSGTLSGISDFQIIYPDTADLKKQLEAVLRKWIKTTRG